MGKRVHIALAVVLAAVAGLIAWQGLHPKEREPVYQGKALRVWLSESYYGRLRQDARGRDAAEGAIRHVGTNAIPTLLNMLRKKDSPLVSMLIPVWDRHVALMPHHLPVWIRFPSWYRTKAAVLNHQALTGFEILRADAHQAVPALIKIYDQDISPDSRFYTSRALIAVGPGAARRAIPSFLRGAASANTRVRQDALYALSQAPGEPSVVVPALVKGLSDADASIRKTAVMGLKEVGFAAQPAVPALVRMLSDPDVQVRSLAAQALLRIDYDAAVKAGLK
jgi:hypothetical protein